jgi:ubiquitin-protein ligase E3 C
VYVLVDDLLSLDPEMYKNLLFLKNYQGNIDDLALNFSIMKNGKCFYRSTMAIYSAYLMLLNYFPSLEIGEIQHTDLIPGGRDIPVTLDNKLRYIYLVANYKLNKEIEIPCRAFLRGFSDLIRPEWIRMFNQHELRTLICGASISIDVGDLMANTLYSGGYSLDHPTIQIFWKVVRALDELHQALLLKFVTSCSRPPLLGFKELYPKFCIHFAGSEDRLPTSSTCMNLLKLPEFHDEKVLRDRLIYSIESGAGFDLS